jgi:hypothetical protein
MLSAADFIHLPCTQDLGEAGCAYIRRRLALARAGKNETTERQLRRTVAEVAVELAFRRYLSQQSIRIAIAANTPFIDPDRYELSLGNRRCELTTYLISHGKQAALLYQDSSLMLQGEALIPSDEFAAEYHREDDIHIFAFLLAGETGLRGKAAAAIGASPPAFWLYCLPKEWARPAHWLPFKDLALRNETNAPFSVELGGMDHRHELLTTRLELPPLVSTKVQEAFYSLAYVHALGPTRARLRLDRPAAGAHCSISPGSWANLRLEGMEIVLAGWLSHEEFRRRATYLNAGARTLSFDRTRVKNRMVRMVELEPLASLLEPYRKPLI